MTIVLLLVCAFPIFPSAQASDLGVPGPVAQTNDAGPSLRVAPAQLQADLQRVVELTNQERAKHGLPALTMDGALNNAAQAHSQDMASRNYFSHTGADGSDPGQRIANAGYSPLWAYGENIAAGQSTPEEVVAAWMNSEGHRANILSPHYTHIGVGYAYNEGSTYKHYWTQEFASHGQVVATPVPPTPVPPTPVPPTPVPPTPVPPTPVPPTPVPPTPVPPTPVPPTPVPPTPVPPTSVPPTDTPVQPTSAPAVPTPGPVSPDFAQQVLDLTNRERTERGLVALSLDPALNKAAQGHSEDMAAHRFFGHTGSDGSEAKERIAEAGYSPIAVWAENLGGGQLTAAEVVAAWMNSPKQRDNILNPAMRHLGVGYAYDPEATYVHYWTQVLASHRGGSDQSPDPSDPIVRRFWRFLPLLRLWIWR